MITENENLTNVEVSSLHRYDIDSSKDFKLDNVDIKRPLESKAVVKFRPGLLKSLALPIIKDS